MKIELKTNHIQKALVRLERLFDNNDVYIKPSIQAYEGTTIDCNLGTDNEPKFVKISKVLSDEKRQKYINLMKEYFDVFVWKY